MRIFRAAHFGPYFAIRPRSLIPDRARAVLRSSLARMMYSGARTRLLSSVHKDVINVSLAICHADDLRTWTFRRQLTRQSISFQPTKTFFLFDGQSLAFLRSAETLRKRDQKISAPHDAQAQFVRRTAKWTCSNNSESPLDVQTPSILRRMPVRSRVQSCSWRSTRPVAAHAALRSLQMRLQYLPRG